MKRTLLVPCLVSVFGFGALSVQSTTFTVTRTNATGPGSLPVIVNQANATPGDNVIEFSVTGPVVLEVPLPAITNNVTINGRMDVPTVISGGGTVPIFSFAAGTTNLLSQLVLTNGYSTGDGAAISNAGTLFVNACVFTGSRSRNGGAVLNAGEMTVVGSAFAHNQANHGGGIYSSGTLTIETSAFEENRATPGNGGGILSGGSASVSNSWFRGNQAGNGGAIYSVGRLAAATLSISNNLANLGFGGGVFNSGSLTLLNTTVSSNKATGSSGGTAAPYGVTVTGGGGAGLGGGLFTEGGPAAITNCTFSGNAALGGSGGTFNGASGFGGGNNGATTNSAAGFGGGGWAEYTGGFGGGGSGSPGQPGGPGPFGQAGCFGINGGGGGGAGLGAGIFVKDGYAMVMNCTLTANFSQGGAAGEGLCPGLAGNSAGAGVFTLAGTVGVLNTIIAANTAFYWPGKDNLYPDVYGAVVSGGYNLIGDSQGATGLSINDYQNVPANLGPLQDNGGPTLTCALLQGSLAIGAGTSLGAPSTDQRGVARPSGKCDLGAFQLVTLITPTIQWPKPVAIVYGTPLGSGQLNASVAPAGTLTYSPPAGTLLSAGSNQVLQVVFMPSDPTRYTSATNSVRIDVLKANQTITFGPIPNHQLGDPPVILNASASSGLPVALAIASGPAMLTGNLLSFGSTSGWITVTARQPGNSNYNSAPELDQTFYLGVLPLPVITVQPASQVVLPGDRVSFTVTATNGPLSYQWLFFGRSIEGATASALALARVQASQAGPYQVIINNPVGSVTSVVANLTVILSQGTPRITAQPQDLAIRVGESAALSVAATGDSPLTYQWYRGLSGDTTAPMPGTATNALLVTGLTANTCFWVSVQNSLGGVDSATATVTVLPAKAARLKLTTFNGLAGLVIDGLPGTQYRLDATTNLSSGVWSKAADLVLPSSPYTFIDPTSVNVPFRFYRAVAQ